MTAVVIIISEELFHKTYGTCHQILQEAPPAVRKDGGCAGCAWQPVSGLTFPGLASGLKMVING